MISACREAERYCQAVISWADYAFQARGPADVAGAKAVVRRLEAELEGHLRGGTLELPPAPPPQGGAP